MTLPTTGPISIGMAATELGIALPLSLGDARVRALAGVPSGPISLGQLRGKSANTGTPAPAFAVSRQDASGTANSTTVGGTVACGPSVSESGGTAPYSRTWSFTSNPSGCTLSNSNSATCTVSHTFGKQSTGYADAILQCVSTDSAGASITTGGINAHLEWAGTQ